MLIGVLSGIVGIQLLLLVLSRNEPLPENKEYSSVLKPFYRAGFRLAGYVGKFPLFVREEKKLKILYPADHVEKTAYLFLAEKIAVSLLVLFMGCIIAILTAVKDQGAGRLLDGRRLNRQEYSEGNYTTYLTAEIEGESSQEFEVTVQERQYTTEEIRELLPAFLEELEKTVLGRNESFDRVNQEVNLPESIEGYPFRIKWSSSNNHVLDRYGVFGEDISEQGDLITLSAEISYRGYMEIYTFPLMVYPIELSRREQIRKDLQQMLEEADILSEEDTAMILPTDVEGITVIWQEQKKKNALVLIVLTVCSSIAIFWGKNNELDQKLKERTEQMNMDYPEIVSKITLLIGAGMTVRGAWKKIVSDYKKRRDREHITRYVYEEMTFTQYEMESGISELEAYRRFANRCQVQKYVKLASLLEQNVRLGAKGFIEELNREAKDAFEERKSNANQIGEKAGSKLMLPMFLMLGIVMVVIMVPSFLSIGM